MVYTKERESGDLYIEKLLAKVGWNSRVKLVTSDAMIQLSALRKGILRVSSAEFENTVSAAEEEIREFLEKRGRASRVRIGDEIAGFRELLSETAEQEDGNSENRQK